MTFLEKIKGIFKPSKKKEAVAVVESAPKQATIDTDAEQLHRASRNSKVWTGGSIRVGLLETGSWIATGPDGKLIIFWMEAYRILLAERGMTVSVQSLEIPAGWTLKYSLLKTGQCRYLGIPFSDDDVIGDYANLVKASTTHQWAKSGALGA